jgi:hypothetical protein
VKKHANVQRSGKSDITCTRNEASMLNINPLTAEIKLRGSGMYLE